MNQHKVGIVNKKLCTNNNSWRRVSNKWCTALNNAQRWCQKKFKRKTTFDLLSSRVRAINRIILLLSVCCGRRHYFIAFTWHQVDIFPIGSSLLVEILKFCTGVYSKWFFKSAQNAQSECIDSDQIRHCRHTRGKSTGGVSGRVFETNLLTWGWFLFQIW